MHSIIALSPPKRMRAKGKEKEEKEKLFEKSAKAVRNRQKYDALVLYVQLFRCPPSPPQLYIYMNVIYCILANLSKCKT